jgi:hypothetical protein
VSAAVETNGQVRRVDWRFLTGTPKPRRVLCLAGGELRDAVRSVAGEVVVRAPPGSCDLAVLHNPGPAEMSKACDALRPGGALYTESWRPLRDRASALTRELARAGFAEMASYWPWPPPNRATPNFWLPVESDAAVSWLLRDRPHAARGISRVATRIARGAWWLLWRAGVLVPVCVTARKPSTASDTATGAEESLTAVARRDLEPELPERSTHGVACLLLTGGRSASNKVVALAFADEEPSPRLALKLPRVSAAEEPLRHEAAVLRRLRDEGMVEGIPRVLAEHEMAGGIAVAESVVAGRPMTDVLEASAYPALASQVTSLLAELATHRPTLVADWWTWIAEPSLDVLEGSERDRARELLTDLGELPEVPEHRDCSPWNVIVQADGSLALLDWESSEAAGLPGPDLIYFLAFASFFVDHTIDTGREAESYDAMLDPATTTGAVYRQCTAEYARRVGVTTEQIDRLRLLCWLVHARSAELRRDTTAAGTPLLPLFLQLARRELDRQG